MVSAGDDQARIRHLFFEDVESREHQLQPLVGSPFSESENAMLGSAAEAEVGELGTPRQNAMRAQMHIIAAVLLEQDLAVAGHQNRNRIR